MSCLQPVGDDAENVSRICGFTGICHCTGVKGLNALLSAIFRVEYLIPQTY